MSNRIYVEVEDDKILLVIDCASERGEALLEVELSANLAIALAEELRSACNRL